MIRDDLLKLHDELSKRAKDLMVRKNHDYSGEAGDDPFGNFRVVEQMGICSTEKGVLVRMADKMKRLTTFADCGRLVVENEGAEDAVLDIMNYAIILAGIIRERSDVV